MGLPQLPAPCLPLAVSRSATLGRMQQQCQLAQRSRAMQLGSLVCMQQAS